MKRLTYSWKTVFRSWKRSVLLMFLVFLASVLLCMGCVLKWESDKGVAEAASKFRVIGLFDEENQQVDLWEEEYQYLKELDYVQVEEPMILSASSPVIKMNPMGGISYMTVSAYSQTEEYAYLFSEDQNVFTFRYLGEGYGEVLSVLAGVADVGTEPLQIYNYSSCQESLQENEIYIAYGMCSSFKACIQIFDFEVKEYPGLEKEAEKSLYWEEICSVVEQTSFPLTVMSTQAVEDIHSFHENMALVEEGESFSEEMYAEGAKVCLINEKLADFNKLKVGDEISLSFYESDYVLRYRINTAGKMDWDKTEKLREHLSEETFTIVGIYSFVATPEEMLELELNERTILVPEKALSSYFDEEMLDTYQIGNDVNELPYATIHLTTETMDRFIRDTSSLAGLQVQLYDQGYSGVKNSLKTYQELASVLLSVGIICAVVVCCFVAYFEGRARAMERRVYRALGYGWKEIVLRFAISLSLICLPGVLAGCISGQIASDRIVEAAFQGQDNIHFYEGVSISQ